MFSGQRVSEASVRRMLFRPHHAPPQTSQPAFESIDEFRQIPTTTNAYQRDQQNTNRIPKEILVTPHALKLLERPIRDSGSSKIHEDPRWQVKILVTTASWPSKPRLRRAASRSRSLARLAASSSWASVVPRVANQKHARRGEESRAEPFRLRRGRRGVSRACHARRPARHRAALRRDQLPVARS
jgi:hypothetical protein